MLDRFGVEAQAVGPTARVQALNPFIAIYQVGADIRAQARKAGREIDHSLLHSKPILEAILRLGEATVRRASPAADQTTDHGTALLLRARPAMWAGVALQDADNVGGYPADASHFATTLPLDSVASHGDDTGSGSRATQAWAAC